MEFGAEQGRAVEDIFCGLPDWTDVRIHKDLAGLDRCLEAWRSVSPRGKKKLANLMPGCNRD
jgi:methylase of polypeptide subunit release factors